ncbi:hypothetical protein V1264_015624 [Littorina saxatilis]|uniref:Uncharacterized protein n=1 Tax=Littorina saxatilis TaxID=31220 RepID=A0AAN9GG73_9CAEN
MPFSTARDTALDTLNGKLSWVSSTTVDTSPNITFLLDIKVRKVTPRETRMDNTIITQPNNFLPPGRKLTLPSHENACYIPRANVHHFHRRTRLHAAICQLQGNGQRSPEAEENILFLRTSRSRNQKKVESVTPCSQPPLPVKNLNAVFHRPRHCAGQLERQVKLGVVHPHGRTLVNLPARHRSQAGEPRMTPMVSTGVTNNLNAIFVSPRHGAGQLERQVSWVSPTTVNAPWLAFLLAIVVR